MQRQTRTWTVGCPTDSVLGGNTGTILANLMGTPDSSAQERIRCCCASQTEADTLGKSQSKFLCCG